MPTEQDDDAVRSLNRKILPKHQSPERDTSISVLAPELILRDGLWNSGGGDNPAQAHSPTMSASSVPSLPTYIGTVTNAILNAMEVPEDPDADPVQSIRWHALCVPTPLDLLNYRAHN